MATPKISIIIPVYNAAGYIEQCIRSVMTQTIKDIEIIAVNDGSTDESKEMLDRLAATDERLLVFHQSNKGVSATRNFGLQQATGSYIGFCDADDWMEPDMLQELYNAITLQNCEWAICNVNMHKEGQPLKVRLQLKDEVMDVADDRTGLLHGLMRFYYDYANWNKLFSAAIIRKYQLGFREDMSIWEDLLFNLQYLHYVNRVAVVAKPLYNYRILPTSLYSGQSKDRVPQFNLLYRHFIDLSSDYTSTDEQEAFRKEMARLTYNHLLYEAEVRVRKKTNHFLGVWRGCTLELNRFDTGVFYYSTDELKGIQGIKKNLLLKKQFNLFALIIAVKPLFKKPAKFVLKFLRR
ncbi:glycosyltransferase family 2 protein [Lacibacter sediminis]|uniref:Glycosyltransferase n=1 Tax=Lacibacter sediminis TaxID=2760713 RepID=A0A7G5XHP1_9BACT|nr:glycosyltransferase [Lacibacter sediminis]QNA44994.1 glycosyltransferase [Lacibacter sediminis]